MPIYFNIIIIFVLFFFNAIFAMYEIAMVAAKKMRLQQRADDGVKGAAAALDLLKDPNQPYLSTVQIMITLIDTLAGGIGGASLASPLAEQVSKVVWLADYAGILSLIFVVVVITYFSIVLGELIPKRMAVSKPENIVIALSPSIRTLTKIFRPLTKLLGASTNFGLKLFRINTDRGPTITTEEIKGYIEEGRGLGLIEDAEQEMLSGVLRLGDRRVEALMTPRLEMTWIDLNAPMDDIWEQLLQSAHSRIPVAQGDLDQISGYIQTRDLLGRSPGEPGFNLNDFIKEPVYVSENMAALKALEAIQNSGVHLAMVIDEYGGITGMVTDYDILEAIVGEIPEDGTDTDYLAFQRDDGSWLFDGLIVIDQLKEILNISEMPDEDRAGYQTLSGFVMSQLGRIPKTGAKFNFGDYQFEVVDMDGRRVDRVLVSLLTEDADKEE
ncbi:MAG: hemolysin family protein [Brevefilum sp.]|nr:hemolysin family protein [Brevefilum sp.]